MTLLVDSRPICSTFSDEINPCAPFVRIYWNSNRFLCKYKSRYVLSFLGIAITHTNTTYLFHVLDIDFIVLVGDIPIYLYMPCMRSCTCTCTFMLTWAHICEYIVVLDLYPWRWHIETTCTYFDIHFVVRGILVAWHAHRLWYFIIIFFPSNR